MSDIFDALSLSFGVVLLSIRLSSSAATLFSDGGKWRPVIATISHPNHRIASKFSEKQEKSRKSSTSHSSTEWTHTHTHTLTVCKTLMTLVMLWLEKKRKIKKGKRCFALHCCRWLLDNSKRTNVTSGQRAYWDGHRHEEHAGPMECVPPPSLPLSSSALVPTTHPQKCSSEELKS